MADRERTLKARLPRGLADRSAADIRATERMVATIRRVYERYGFEPGETPLIEYSDALGKFLPDQDRPNEGVFSFRDDDAQEARSGEAATGKQGEWLSLRYDLTAPLARYVAENYERLPKPYRSYRAGWVFRNEKPGPGRFRQFLQFDADTVGSASPAADAEMCMMMADTMEALGIPRGQYVIKVSSRKLLEGLRGSLSMAEPIDDGQWIKVLRSVDKLDRLGPNDVNLLLTKGRRDASGDYSAGAGLSSTQSDNIMRFLGYSSRVPVGGDTFEYLVDDFLGARTKGNADWLRWFANSVALTEIGAQGLRELVDIATIAAAAGYDETRIRIDRSVVRGLEYYTGAVFEAELLAEIPNEKGQPVVFGSVGGGGRYDGLVGRFMSENVPAVGFSIGVSRLQAALSALGKLDDVGATGPVVVLVMDKERIGDYQKMVADLRRYEIPAELYLGSGGMKAQMKYADKRDAPLAIIQGGDEKARGVVQIKDLVAGKKAAATLGDHDAYREARPGQVEVPEDELVERVNALLGRGERRAP